MKYIVLVLVVLAAGLFFINYQTADTSAGKIKIEAMAAEKNSLEAGAVATLKFFQKYKLALKNPVTIKVMSNKEAYKELLRTYYHIDEGTVDVVAAGRGFYSGDTIFINTQAANSELLRTATVAHEFTHHYQQQMAPDGAILQWLQEGMADAAACDILEQSGQAQIQPQPVKQLKLPAELNLAHLNTDENWIKSVEQYGANAVYAYSVLATRRLISQKGFISCINYYQELNHTHDIGKSFKTAFGMELNQYQKDFSEYIKNNQEDIYYYNYY